MRKILKRWLYNKGYEIVKIGKVRYHLERLQKVKGSPIKFLQVGANDGVSFDNLFKFVTLNSSRGVVVEPLPNYFEQLKRNYRDYSDIVPIQVAIHPEAENYGIFKVNETSLKSYPDWANGIASFLRDHLINHGILEEDIVEVEVPCISLMNLIKKYDLFDMDYLQVDTEGFDFEVLHQLDFTKVKPTLIKFEKVHMSEYKYSSLRKKLESVGYKLLADGRDELAIQGVRRS